MPGATTSPVTVSRAPKPRLFRVLALVLTILILNPAISGMAVAQTGSIPAARIISTNICIDTLLVALADRATITALSPLAADRRFSTIADKAAGIPAVKFTAEDIYRLKPTIVFVSNFASPRTRAALTKLGITVVAVNYARSIDDIKANILSMGQTLGTEDTAWRLIAALETAATNRRLPRPLSALQYSRDKFTHGTHSLIADIISKAGFTRPDRLTGSAYGTFLSSEEVLIATPDLLVLDKFTAYDSYNLKGDYLGFDRNSAQQGQTAFIDTKLWSCGSPAAAHLIKHLNIIGQSIKKNNYVQK